MSYYCFVRGEIREIGGQDIDDDGNLVEVEKVYRQDHLHVTCDEELAREYSEDSDTVVIRANTIEEAEKILKRVDSGKAQPVEKWTIRRSGKFYGIPREEE